MLKPEDVVQETLVRALQTWRYYGIPKNLLYVILGEFEARLGKPAAIKNFRKALELATMQSERIFIARKIADMDRVKSGGAA